MQQTLGLEMTHVTEQAALAAFALVGHGDEKRADQVAVDAMRKGLHQLAIAGEVVIGEGERDQAPMLYSGEHVGTGKGPAIDIALDPLEGTTLTAKGYPGAMSVMAFGEKGALLKAPDVYMDKMAVGPGVPPDALNLDMPVLEKLRRVARALQKPLSQVTVCVLERPRHQALIQQIRLAGAKIALITDWDVGGAIATCQPETGIDLYLGIGGAPEGVLAAAALKAVGGHFQGRLLFQTRAEQERAALFDLKPADHLYTAEELAAGHVFFCATGVTSGSLVKGIAFDHGKLHTHTLLLCSQTNRKRTLKTWHTMPESLEMKEVETQAAKALG